MNEVNDEWTEATIDDVSEKVAMGPFGSSIKVSTFVEQGIPVISGQHLHGSRLDEKSGFNYITDKHAEKLKNANVYRGDIVFTHRGTLGQVSYIPEHSVYDQYIISQSQFYMRCKKTLAIPEYVVYFFRSTIGQQKLLANANQTGVPSIARPVTYLRSIKIPLPPLSEQRAIAHILGTLDDKIELNRRMNETLEAMARAIFKSWFVDFDPVRAHAEGRQPVGMDAETAALFPSEFEDSELGPIPKGWKIGKVEDLCTLYSGKRPSAMSNTTKTENKIPVYGGAGVIGYVQDYLFEKPMLITGRVGTLGLVHRVYGGCWPSDNTIVIEPVGEFMLEWLYHVLLNNNIAELNSGSTQPLLTQRALKAVNIIIPYGSVIKRYHEISSTYYVSHRKYELQSRTLAALRDTLLPKLVSGEICVRDAERFVAEAV